MNWLAHFALSPAHDRVWLGNWLADLFPRPTLEDFSDPDIRRGLALHRVIDHATDRHPRFRAALAALPSGLRRGGGIALDVFWDHFLTQEFTARTGRELGPFVGEVLAGLDRAVYLAPAGTRPVLIRMRAENWLGSYGTLDGVELALTRISLRLSHRARAALPPRVAREFLAANHAELQEHFAALWPDVVRAVA